MTKPRIAANRSLCKHDVATSRASPLSPSLYGLQKAVPPFNFQGNTSCVKDSNIDAFPSHRRRSGKILESLVYGMKDRTRPEMEQFVALTLMSTVVPVTSPLRSPGASGNSALPASDGPQWSERFASRGSSLTFRATPLASARDLSPCPNTDSLFEACGNSTLAARGRRGSVLSWKHAATLL